MFHLTYEGGPEYPGLNLRFITDGGFTVIWRGPKRRYRIRWRGNRRRPDSTLEPWKLRERLIWNIQRKD